MKTRIFKYIAVVALLFMAIPMQGQNYLRIWFKDGHTEDHFMHLVQSISTTKNDLEGNLHSDYQIQQIVMKDTTYSYYIADIDSMSFRKVEKEHILTDYSNIKQYVNPIMHQSTSFEDFEKHLDDIRALEGVENAYSTGSDIVVQVRDWRKIIYHFHEKESPITNAIQENSKLMLKSSLNKLNTIQSTNAIKVGIAFQQGKDENRNTEYDDLSILKNNFEDLGYDVKFIQNHTNNNIYGILDRDFYGSRIFDFNIVLLCTHGMYDGTHHWLLSSEEASDEEIEEFLSDECVIDKEEQSIGSVPEKRSNQDVESNYWMFSEKYIERVAKNCRFDNSFPAVILCSACESLKGNKTLIREINGEREEFKGDDSMAQTFFKKNAKLYLGYNQSDGYGWYYVPFITQYMLHGYSIEKSIYDLPSLARDENTYEYLIWRPGFSFNQSITEKLMYDICAHLVDVEVDKKYKGIFFVPTHTIKLTSDEVENEFLSTGKVTLKGVTTILYHNLDLKCGIRYGTESQLKTESGYKVAEGHIKPQSISPAEDNVNFSASIDVPSSCQTIYYQAYTYDGIHYNLGEIYSFTTPEASTPYHDLCPDGNHPHMIDLGLPSGTKWSCCNVGASVPTAYGNYYAWGETSTKSTYTKENYKYHHTDSDGKYVYDDATFTMAPTPDQVKELFANCTAAETSVDGVAGEKLTSKKNGKKIFLPYGGAKGTSTVGVGEEYQYWTSQLEKSASNSKLLAPRQYSDNETDDLGNPYAFDWYEKDFRYIGKTVRKASK